jgi:thiamine pyrophosphate-dependent acetolactate synthase large subunit-like protein
MTQSVGDLLGRCLAGLGADRVFGSPDSGIRRLPGLRHVAVSDPLLAVLLADAAGRLGQGPGVALLPGQRMHLGSQPGSAPELVVVDDASALPAVIAGWSFGQVHAALEIEVALDLDAPAPEGVEPLRFDEETGEMLALSPSLASFRSLVLAGPGVVRGGFVGALRSFAEQSGFGVVNTWGAKGVFVWDSPYHLGTAGLQARDFELAGFGDAELVVAVGLDPLESPRSSWAHGQVLDVEPWQLASLAWRWEAPADVPARPPLYTQLAAALADHYASPAVPLSPARAAGGLAQATPSGALVLADPGPAGLWVARAFPTTEPGSVVVPSSFVRGFAVAGAIVAALDHRPAVAVVADPPDAATLELLALAEHWDSTLTLEIWGADTSLASPEAHTERLAGSFAEPGVKVLPVPVDFAQTRVLVEVAGEVVAWRDPVLQSADG